MPLNIESELLQLVIDPTVSSVESGTSAFHQPVITAYAALSPPQTKIITDDIVLDRLAYNQVAQDVLKPPFIPYLYWTGPLNYDKGQTAQPSRVVKKADFWFWCCHNTLTKSMAWANDIEAAIDRLTFPYNLLHCRLTAAIFIGKYPLGDDQTIKTAQEYPVSRAAIGYTFGYQSSGN